MSAYDDSGRRIYTRGSASVGVGLALTVSQVAPATPPIRQLPILCKLGHRVSGRFDHKFAPELYVRLSATPPSDHAAPLDRYRRQSAAASVF